MKTTLLLGAGFSKWAINLPVASQLFDFNIKMFGPRENKKLLNLKKLKLEWDQSNPGKFAEEFIADALTYQNEDKELVLWYIVRRLSEPFIWTEFHSQRFRRHTLMINENRKLKIPGIIKTQDFLKIFYNKSLSGILTTNYDLLVEYALGTNRFNYGIINQELVGRGAYPLANWNKPVLLSGTVPFAKIHGSVSWDKEKYYTDGRGGITGKALIVAPSPNKQLAKSLPNPYELSKKILMNSTQIVVFGFAFNQYDKEILDLLREYGTNIDSVLLINIVSQTTIAQNIWPSANITFSSPPPDGLSAIMDWQREK